MKIILSEDVDNLGEMGQTVNVAPGYARNYLIPRKLAVLAESASAKQIEHELGIIKRREEKKRAETRAFAGKLEGVTVDIKARAGEGGKIFGSVTTAQITEKLGELGYEVDKKLVRLAEPIKSLGIFTATIRFPGSIEAEVKVWVSSLEEPKPAKHLEEEAEEDTDDGEELD